MKHRSAKLQMVIGCAISIGSVFTLVDRIVEGERYLLPAISLVLGVLTLLSALTRVRQGKR